MSSPKEMLRSLNLPAFMPEDARRADWPALQQKMKALLLQEEYGVIPPMECSVKGEVKSEYCQFCAGKSTLYEVELTVTLPLGSYVFPCHFSLPNSPGPHPLFVYLDFYHAMPSRYLPIEEITERGYAVIAACHNLISKDAADDYQEGLGKFLRDGAKKAGIPDEQLPGKLAIWAWAASRMLDYALTHPAIDENRTAVIGHSRLGKAALVSALNDPRFQAVIANNSGCSGAAITREKAGEHIRDIVGVFPFWFCDNYHKYVDREDTLPFDQHFLLAALAPRLVITGSALDDQWAGPDHEYLSCMEAGRAWELLGLPGFVGADRLPKPGDVFHEGSIGYHLRTGCHYLSRHDWMHYMDFLDEKGWK
ncbi:MAG: hypothetical protein IJB69_01960 [Clostridia bacterium]|nr:hypothetical protein [Clostridia bacterium]